MASTDSRTNHGLDSDRKRSSIIKGSFQSDAGLYGSKTGVKQLFTTPSQSHSRMTPGGHTFLCVMGSIISVAICIWLAAFSREPGWRRAVFAGGSALCAVMFIFLAFMTIRRAKHPPEPEPLPDLSQRRSTIGARVSKKSIAVSGHGGNSNEDCPTQVLVAGDFAHPTLAIG
ncbi:hypothetical protein DICVIV_08247 [Dictyocaulus viviparus]|uniref:Uncharacterized protein n=1 Tax=Dictyocaulus viviparus TaxID=29172 RepID=A0A0D8XM75_DICVI|nr:hypothetical protein DICVIV_08247 [Dictyocaulus viviparus]